MDPLPVLNKEDSYEMKLVSITVISSSGQNILELNACTPLKRKLRTQHNEFHCKEWLKIETNFEKT